MKVQFGKKIFGLSFELGFNVANGQPQLQRTVRDRDGVTIKYVLANDTPADVMATINDEDVVVLVQANDPIVDKGNFKIVPVSIIEIVRSGVAIFREGKPGFFWAAGQTEGGIPVHFIVHKDEKCIPKSGVRYNFEVFCSARPLQGEIPAVVVGGLTEKVSERAIRRRQRKAKTTDATGTTGNAKTA